MVIVQIVDLQLIDFPSLLQNTLELGLEIRLPLMSKQLMIIGGGRSCNNESIS